MQHTFYFQTSLDGITATYILQFPPISDIPLRKITRESVYIRIGVAL